MKLRAGMVETADSLLVADIGGTWARFAVSTGGALGPIAAHRVADFATPLDAARQVLQGQASRPRRAAFAVAGPLIEGRIALTNADWLFDRDELRRGLDLDAVLLLNDFEAIAYALPVLPPEALVQIGAGAPEPAAARVVMGPGTGLGVAGLLTLGDRSQVVRSEGGHASMAAGTAAEAALLDCLRKRLGHVSAERVLSGEGLINLHRACAEMAGASVEPAPPTPAEITERALARRDPHAVAALDRFCAMLGAVAGDLALTFCAEGGVYIAGGIAPRIVDLLKASEFRARFQDKGRFAEFLGRIPTWVITEPHPALYGLAAADRQRPAATSGAA